MQTAVKILIGIGVGLLTAGLIIFIVVAVTIGFSVGSDVCETTIVPSSDSVSNNDEGYLISWYEYSINAECEVTYLLQYSVDDEQEFSVNITTNNYLIPNLRLDNCATLQLNLWVISQSGAISEDFVTRTYTERPSELFITGINFTNVTEGLLLTWNKPIELVRCEINYTLSIYTDLDTINTNLLTESVIVPDENYCFQVTATFDGRADDYLISWAYSVYSDREMDSDRIGIIISPDNSEELIVTWYNHPKEELCGVEYVVEFSSDGDVDWQSVNVSIPEARFNFLYCEEAIVIIATYGLNRETRGPYAIVEATQWPKSPIGKVQDITVDEPRDGFITVGWKSPAYVSQCNIEYTVTATHPTAGRATCSGLSSCNITLNDYCPYTILVIVATSLDGQPISGEDIAHTYICNSSKI